MLSFTLLVVCSYLIGSVSFAVVISRMYKLSDPRTYGSNNAGATNVMRSGNKKAAVLTLLGDLLKGLLVIILARLFLGSKADSETLIAVCGIAVILGHIYPIFFRFKGGKGVATAIGVLFGLNFWVAILCIATWLLVFLLFKISSLAAIIATIAAPVYAYLLMGNNAFFGATLVIAFFILYTHKSNLFRLITGKEHRFKKNSEVAENK